MIEKIPNILSVSRIVSAPIMLIVSLYGLSNVFLVIFLVAFISDGLDGFIARRFNCESEVGGRLDTWGDFAVFSLLPFCAIILWPEKVLQEMAYILGAVVSIIIPIAYGIVKFKEFISFHTILSKISLFMLGVSTLVMFVFDWHLLFKIAVFIQIVSGFELVLIVHNVKIYKSNIKSIFNLIEK